MPYRTTGVGSNNSTQASGIINGSGPAAGAEEMYIDGAHYVDASVGRGSPAHMDGDRCGRGQSVPGLPMAACGHGGQGVANYSVKQVATMALCRVLPQQCVLDAWRLPGKRTPNAQVECYLVNGREKPE